MENIDDNDCTLPIAPTYVALLKLMEDLTQKVAVLEKPNSKPILNDIRDNVDTNLSNSSRIIKQRILPDLDESVKLFNRRENSHESEE